MPNTIRIKRSDINNSPSSLLNGELAWSSLSNILYIGNPSGTPLPIGGNGYFAPIDSPNLLGTPRSTTPDLGSNNDNIATTAFVKGQHYLTENQSISINGDVNGTGTNNITLNLTPTGVTPGTYTKLSVDEKGRVTTGNTLSASDIPSLSHTKIVDLLDVLLSLPISYFQPANTSISLGDNTITNLGPPINSHDAVNKSYVDTRLQGLDLKDSVRVASTTNVLLTGLSIIDGISISEGDRILLKDQTNPVENGIYIVSGGAWIRASDFNTNSNITPSAFVMVEEGDTNKNTGWVLITDGIITPGVTPLSFTKFMGVGSITSLSPLVVNGNEISLNYDNTHLSVIGDALSVHDLIGINDVIDGGTY